MGVIIQFPKARSVMTESTGFYSVAQASRITRVPKSTLYDWKSLGIIVPSVQVFKHGKVDIEGYSYADLTIIRITRALRQDRLTLDSVGIALSHLFDRLGPPSKGWADANVYIEGNKIYAEKKDNWGTTAATQFGQKVETRLFGDLFTELRDCEEPGEILVPRDLVPFVEINPNKMGGQPVVRGTRLPTAMVAALRDMGNSIAEIVRLYMTVSRQFIEKAIEYENYLNTAIA